MAARPAAARSSKSKTPAPSGSQAQKSQRNRRYHEKNRERSLAGMRRRYSRLSPAEKTLRHWRLRAKPSMPKPGSFRAKDPRNIVLANAYCEWSDIDEVVRTYLAAALMCEITGEQYVVDHVVPLSNPFVCGLHTHTNLEVVTLELNQAKSNLLWPDMWEISWESLELLQKSC